MSDRIGAVRLIRDIVARLDKLARETDDRVLAAKLTRMAREAAAHAAELEAADR
jgi:hypothetical protein